MGLFPINTWIAKRLYFHRDDLPENLVRKNTRFRLTGVVKTGGGGESQMKKTHQNNRQQRRPYVYLRDSHHHPHCLLRVCNQKFGDDFLAIDKE